MRRQQPAAAGIFQRRGRRGIAAAMLGTVALAALAACSGLREPPKPVNPNLMPTNYKTDIQKELRSRMADPVGVRDAFISAPALKQTGTVERYVSCVRYTAKDDTGNYSPPSERAVFFYAGEITQVVDDGAKDLCRGAAYQPWPELMRMCKELVCPGR